MDGIYKLGVHNVAWCIILFTIIINLILLPLTIKQQKFMKLNAVMQPELTAIQKKYKNKQQDQAAMQKMQMEQQAVYDRYGASPTGGCLTTIIQLPILFALYQVIYRIPAYITEVKTLLMQVADPLMKQTDYITKIADLASANKLSIEKIDYTQANKVVDLLGKFTASSWKTLADTFPDIADTINSVSKQDRKSVV